MAKYEHRIGDTHSYYYRNNKLQQSNYNKSPQLFEKWKEKEMKKDKEATKIMTILITGLILVIALLIFAPVFLACVSAIFLVGLLGRVIYFGIRDTL